MAWRCVLIAAMMALLVADALSLSLPRTTEEGEGGAAATVLRADRALPHRVLRRQAQPPSSDQDEDGPVGPVLAYNQTAACMVFRGQACVANNGSAARVRRQDKLQVRLELGNVCCTVKNMMSIGVNLILSV